MDNAIFGTGDAVLIECEGVTVEGVVILASENGKSLMLGFDALLDGYVGMLPVLRDDDGGYRSLVTGVAVTISRA